MSFSSRALPNNNRAIFINRLLDQCSQILRREWSLSARSHDSILISNRRRSTTFSQIRLNIHRRILRPHRIVIHIRGIIPRPAVERVVADAVVAAQRVVAVPTIVSIFNPQSPILNLVNRLLILILAAATFLSLLGRRDIVASHEARVAQTARIMAASGWPWDANPINVPTVDKVIIDGKTELRPAPNGHTMPVNPWLVPVMNAQIRLQKPPLPYWCTATIFRLFGVGETQTRLPNALLGFLATFLIYDLAKIILGPRASWIAAAVWLTTSHFLVDEFRKSTADPYLAFFTLLCIWSYLKSSCSPRACSRFDANQNHQLKKYTLLFYLSLALAVLAKGPVPFITVGLALIPIHFFKRPKPASLSAHFFGLILFVLLAAPWYLYCIAHVPHAIDLWRYESVGEVSGENIEKARQWWSYIAYTFELAVPWTPLWIAGIALSFLHIARRTRCARCIPPRSTTACGLKSTYSPPATNADSSRLSGTPSSSSSSPSPA